MYDLICADVVRLVEDIYEYIGVDSIVYNNIVQITMSMVICTLLLASEGLMTNIKDISKPLESGSLLPVVITEENIHYSVINVNANGHILNKQNAYWHCTRLYQHLPKLFKRSIYAHAQPRIAF